VIRPEIDGLRGLTANEPTLRSKQIERAVGDDAVQPGRKGPSLVKAIKRGKGTLEGVGRDIVGQSPTASDRKGNPPGALPIAAKQRRRGIAISAT
jgi:hypothetical protein